MFLLHIDTDYRLWYGMSDYTETILEAWMGNLTWWKVYARKVFEEIVNED